IGILGLCSLIRPMQAPAISVVDLAAMLIIAVVVLPMCKSGGKISRAEGAFLLTGYVAYTWWLIAQNTA
ncbi:MAG: hypothetical protein RLZZ50_430, partial [Verrucomicrobiota bacterium]